MNKKVSKKNRGFSLVELIIVIAIMAILAGVLAPQFIKYMNNSKKSSDIQNAQMMADAISAQIAEDATTGQTTAGCTIPATGYTFGNISEVHSIVGSTAEVKSKVDSSYEFYYSIDKDGNVKIYVGTGSAVTEATALEITPTIASGATKWK